MGVSVVPWSWWDAAFPGTGGGPKGTPKVVVPPQWPVAPGDLLLVVVGSSKQATSASAGWTQIANTGSGAAWVAAFWRIADGSALDICTVTFGSGGSAAAGTVALRSDGLGFDASSIEMSQQNAATGAGASYALGTTLSGVNAGELSVCFGGMHGTTDYPSNFCGVSGSSWTLDLQGGHFLGAGSPPISGGCMIAHNSVTSTPAIPSVTYNQTSPTFGRFIFGAVVKEAAAVAATPGLFMMM